MKLLKIIISVLFITLFNLNSFSFAETLKFDACSYEGDVKKGKAWGSGVCIFSDGSKYEGQFKKNKIHGEGKFTDSDNNVYEGSGLIELTPKGKRDLENASKAGGDGGGGGGGGCG